MIELLFNDCAAGSLMIAKGQKNDIAGERVAIKTIIDSDGNETVETFVPELYTYTGLTLDGSPSDIEAIWLNADVGDISNLSDSKSRAELLRSIMDVYGYNEEEIFPDAGNERAFALMLRLENAVKSGEPVRIWWSDAPSDACGFYWAMTILKDASGPVTEIKIPAMHIAKDGCLRFRSIGELEPENFSQLLYLERYISLNQRCEIAFEWERLVRENSPLRAMLNGQLCSVSADFYDNFLRSAISDKECKVITVIANAFVNGPCGVSDWWYALRIRAMIASGELEIIKQNKKLHYSTIRAV